MTLDELEKIASAATPGPWEFTPASDGDDWELYNPITTEYIKQDDSGVPIAPENGKFIAAARTYMPKLIAVARAAKDHADYVGDVSDALEKALNALEGD